MSCPICDEPSGGDMCSTCARSYDRYAHTDASIWGALAWAARRARRVLKTRPLTMRALFKAVADLTDEQRVKLFSHFCRECGTRDPRCRCWDDS